MEWRVGGFTRGRWARQGMGMHDALNATFQLILNQGDWEWLELPI